MKIYALLFFYFFIFLQPKRGRCLGMTPLPRRYHGSLLPVRKRVMKGLPKSQTILQDSLSHSLFSPNPNTNEVGDSNLYLETYQGVTSSLHQLLGHSLEWSVKIYATLL